ncbi:MAG: dephospho-CoA kinase [Peptococcaceae bacterium BICA1-7]|nr:MAG: dephospho-CoA kinase [Peptococcaceae bacterium BICA1-7]HBV95896.1 dephospho-CoA kinase [Desulfotomaculum sp.]
MIIGLTGNIGSGKSTVSRRLAQLGAEIIDTDALAREVVAPGTPGLERIIREFGAGMLDEKGELDRAGMAAVVFDDPGARAKLEGIIHPEIHRKVAEIISEYRSGHGKAPALVVEVPLLIESGWNAMMDETWVVTVSPEVQLERVMSRSGLSREDVKKRISAQMPQEEKCRYADRIIDNGGSIERTLAQVDNIWNELILFDHKP